MAVAVAVASWQLQLGSGSWQLALALAISRLQLGAEVALSANNIEVSATERQCDATDDARFDHISTEITPCKLKRQNQLAQRPTRQQLPLPQAATGCQAGSSRAILHSRLSLPQMYNICSTCMQAVSDRIVYHRMSYSLVIRERGRAEEQGREVGRDRAERLKQAKEREKEVSRGFLNILSHT